MALASTTWDDYPIGRSVPSSTRSRGALFSALVASAVVAACAVAAVPAWHVLELFGSIAPQGVSAGTTAVRSDPVFEASRALLERNAESFIADSRRLALRCQTVCAPIASEIAEAETIGRFARPGAVPSGLPLQQRFAPQAAILPSPAPSLAPQVAATVPAPVPAPVRVVPSVAVPLPSAIVGEAIPPVPAPRLDRSIGSAPISAAISEPTEQASLPPTRVMAPVASPAIGRNDGVAIYDISAATVYLPNGERLEAHSGLGYMVDNPRYVDRRDTGPTPPNTYKLVEREGRFHGVDALRLIPVDGNNKYGRIGLLTHTYLLRGRPAQSNGCVAFKDYGRFLEAFKRGYIKRLVVVPTLSTSPMRIASAGGGR